MKRIALLLAVTVVFAIPSVGNATATAYSATLNGPNEAPPNASPGTGSTTIFYDAAAHTMRVVVTFAGLTAGTTASHIHCCVAPPGAAGVATTTPNFAGFLLGVTSGLYDNTLDLTSAGSWNPAFITAHGGTPAGAESALAAGLSAGQAYLNIHTSAFPGGEIRGFLVIPPTAPEVSSAIPALSDWAVILLIVSLATIGLVAMRRRRR